MSKGGKGGALAWEPLSPPSIPPAESSSATYPPRIIRKRPFRGAPAPRRSRLGASPLARQPAAMLCSHVAAIVPTQSSQGFRVPQGGTAAPLGCTCGIRCSNKEREPQRRSETWPACNPSPTKLARHQRSASRLRSMVVPSTFLLRGAAGPLLPPNQPQKLSSSFVRGFHQVLSLLLTLAGPPLLQA